MSNAKDQAFPFMERVWCTDTDQYVLGESTQGMDLRDYFAAKALSGELASSSLNWEGEVFTAVAKNAYKFADAMLEARK